MLFRNRKPKSSKKRWLLLAGVVGIVAAYFLDPARGKARRTRARDQVARKLGRGRQEERDYEEEAFAVPSTPAFSKASNN